MADPFHQRKDCGGVDHGIHRRLFLQGLLGAGAVSALSWSGLFTARALAEQAKKEQKHCILLWLCGAPSQFETWDPKPESGYGGPFKDIPTKVPGVRISELMPRCAQMLDQLAVIRSMKTKPSEHLQGIDALLRGHLPRPPFTRPTIGSVLAQQLGDLSNPIPNFVLLDPCPEGNEFREFKAGNWAGWLGAEYAPARFGGEFRPADVDRLAGISEADHEAREELRRFFSRKYENDRQSAAAGSHNAVFERVKGLMSCAHLFDLERLPAKEKEKYGPGTFGLHTLMARNLVENGAPFVMVANGMPWDCHVFNHEIHQMLVPDLDRILSQLITDLRERGLLEKTLVVAMGEFGRTPWLNLKRGRDHYPDAWSLAMAGCGIRGGVVVGATDKDGIEVTDRPVNEMELFATFFSALGLDPYAEYDLHNMPTFHRVEERAKPVHEILLRPPLHS